MKLNRHKLEFFDPLCSPDTLLTELDLATRWQISEKTLQNARVAGRGIPYIKIGRLVRYRLIDVETYEENNYRLSTSHRGGT